MLELPTTANPKQDGIGCTFHADTGSILGTIKSICQIRVRAQITLRIQFQKLTILSLFSASVLEIIIANFNLDRKYENKVLAPVPFVLNEDQMKANTRKLIAQLP